MRLTPLEPWIARKTADRGRRTAVNDYQLKQLQSTVELARAKSRFYRERLAGAPEIETLDDLQRLPFTTADDVRADPLAFVCVSQDEIARVVTLDSSGTTGTPKRLYFTKADQELTIDFFAVGMSPCSIAMFPRLL